MLTWKIDIDPMGGINRYKAGERVLEVHKETDTDTRKQRETGRVLQCKWERNSSKGRVNLVFY